ncbi:glycosyltransferase family 4 protein [bacterium]|nr:glycosyltransferase family 4 protein [bacterium]
MKLVFLTDHYHPYEVGGAERSLRIVVDRLQSRFDIQVVVLVGEPARPVTVSSVDGVPVTYLSCLPVLDLAHFGAPAGVSRRRRLQAALRGCADSLGRATPSSLRLKLWLAACNLYSSLFCIENYEALDQDYSSLVNLAPLREILEKIGPDLIVSDNSRSILCLPACGQRSGARTLAIIRDLKFSSPRRKVIAHSASGPCDHCTPQCQCMASLPSLIRRPLTRILFLNQAFRLASLQRYDQLLTTSQFLKNSLARHIPNPLRVIPNSVGEILNEVPVRSDISERTRILFAGMLTPNKGPDILLRAMAEFVKECPNADLRIAGRPSAHSADLPALVRQLGLESRVEFLGFLNSRELSQLYASSHIVVCPTRWPEPFGRVPLEAMNHGCLVVASRSGAFPETIEDGRTGWLFQPMDENDLLAKLRLARAEWMAGGPMQQAARASLSRYSVDSVCKQYEDLFLETIGG